MKYINIILSLINPKRSLVILWKMFARLQTPKTLYTQDENIQWLEKNGSSIDTKLGLIDPHLWEQAQAISCEIQERERSLNPDLIKNMGGGGAHSLLYFLARTLEPDNILETGVAAGFSSFALLRGIKENGKGTLYSSDFPYFRISGSKSNIGVLVPDELKKNWILRVDGDRRNLKGFLKKERQFKLIHYDSDKSYQGRKFFMTRISGHISEGAVVVMDDIQDNPFFMDFVLQNKVKDWSVFYWEGKYLGIIGCIRKAESLLQASEPAAN